jgi:hypothetical protein
VRDVRDADVHVFVTGQRAGGGGHEIELSFKGQGRREGSELRLRRATDRDDTAAEIRAVLTRAISEGLLALALGMLDDGRLEALRGVALAAAPVEPSAVEPTADDPWRSWVFRVGGSGSADGESSVGSSSLAVNLSASRITDVWKLQIRADGTRMVSRFELSDAETVVSRREGYALHGLLVRSLGAHAAAGTQASASTSTFLNQDLRVYMAPALEYNVFPYSEAASRRLLVRYAAGLTHYRYERETIFGLLAETLVDQSVLVTLDLLQPWGTATVQLQGVALVRDPAQNRVDLSSDLSWRVARGVSFNVFSLVGRVADQRNLPRGSATDEEILLRRRELPTSFRYSVMIGMSYTFGSRSAGPVNPRFGP